LIIIKKYQEVIEKILELLDTMEEGLDYVQNQVRKLKYEDAFIVMNDLIDALDSIDSSIQPMQNELQQNNINALSSALKVCLNKVVERFDQNNEVNIDSLLENEVILEFTKWKEEIERVLRPYIIC